MRDVARTRPFVRLFSEPEPANLGEVEPQGEADLVVERSFERELDELLTRLPEPDENPPIDIVPVALPSRPAFERIAPLTRVPLRRVPDAITWPRMLDGTCRCDSRGERFALLRATTGASCTNLESALRAAYREEDAEGRLLAMRALQRGGFTAARDIFIEALHIGSDDERSFAVDALLTAGERDAVTHAFSDRLDAISARAALGYVASNVRAEYFTALEPFVDRARIEAILSLLAGIVE